MSAPDRNLPDARVVVMDYPAAWAFVRATDPAIHHDHCSWRTTNGALLCDCDVLWDEYVSRGGTDPRADMVSVGAPRAAGCGGGNK